ncbi:hypothetical protein INT45_007164 [Circinella minor]|uniref:ATP-dependent DNA helicase n=1 Tax=Circinella minor TaxID=1195481 RepID=A0A8H7RUG8_9FUNG|nr:hypothetical protein INT45_007164 [Circinella minor]
MNYIDPYSVFNLFIFDFHYFLFLSRQRSYSHTTPDPQYFAQRAILSPKNAVVDIINDVATDRFPGECREYLSADTVPGEEYANQISTEFLNTLSISEAEIITGSHAGNRVHIPRVKLISSSQSSGLPCEISRKQFPLKPAFCLSINKLQGQTLTHVGVYLPDPVFSHGQLYVAFSRVTDYRNLHIMAEWDRQADRPITKNVVYPEIFSPSPLPPPPSLS